MVPPTAPASFSAQMYVLLRDATKGAESGVNMRQNFVVKPLDKRVRHFAPRRQAGTSLSGTPLDWWPPIHANLVSNPPGMVPTAEAFEPA